MTLKWRITKSCRPLRGLNVWLHHIPGVPLRSTPGSILPPAPQAENVSIHFEQKFRQRAATVKRRYAAEEHHH